MPIEEGAPQHRSQLNNTKIINAAIVQTTSPPPHLFLRITRYYYPGIQFAAWTSFEVCVIKENRQIFVCSLLLLLSQQLCHHQLCHHLRYGYMNNA